MGFLDSLKERLGYGGDDYYEDDYYEDDGDFAAEPAPRSSRRSRRDDRYDDRYDEAPREERRGSGLLGNTSRPSAESVSVYTRSGQYVDSNAGGDDPGAPAPYERNAAVTGDSSWMDSRLDYTPAASERTTSASTTGTFPSQHVTPGDVGLTAIPRGSSTLPPYVLRPNSYDDAQTIVRRVRTGQPVVLSFHNTNIDAAKRILDFSFGFATGIGGMVQELGDRVFVVLPAGKDLSQADIDKLVRDGVLRG